jgi:hypothetical protein
MLCCLFFSSFFALVVVRQLSWLHISRVVLSFLCPSLFALAVAVRCKCPALCCLFFGFRFCLRFSRGAAAVQVGDVRRVVLSLLLSSLSCLHRCGMGPELHAVQFRRFCCAVSSFHVAVVLCLYVCVCARVCVLHMSVILARSLFSIFQIVFVFGQYYSRRSHFLYIIVVFVFKNAGCLCFSAVVAFFVLFLFCCILFFYLTSGGPLAHPPHFWDRCCFLSH